MWKLLVMVVLLNESGQPERFEGEHRARFTTAAECYEAARELYDNAPDNAVSVGAACIRDGQGRDA